jgi:HEAT repeat protein
VRNTASFAKLRPLLESGDSNVRHRADHALRLLTFTDLTSTEVPSSAKPDDWDAWYRRYGRESREQWALRRLRGVKRELYPRHSATAALDYLRRLGDPRLVPTFRMTASSDVYTVRIAAARAIVEFDRAGGLGLLRRELRNRQLGACEGAARALNVLTGQHVKVDFKEPPDRQRAIEAFAAAR